MDSRYLYYFLRGSEKAILGLVTRGATVHRLITDTLKAVQVPIPSLPEQKRIVAILDTTFEGIDAAIANAEKNLANARELFERYLKDTFTDLHAREGRAELGDLCQLISGQHINASDYNVERRGIGYLTGPSDFGPTNPFVSKWTETPKVRASSGDILITVKGSGVGSINLLDQDDVAISRQLMAIRVRPE